MPDFNVHKNVTVTVPENIALTVSTPVDVEVTPVLDKGYWQIVGGNSIRNGNNESFQYQEHLALGTALGTFEGKSSAFFSAENTDYYETLLACFVEITKAGTIKVIGEQTSGTGSLIINGGEINGIPGMSGIVLLRHR